MELNSFSLTGSEGSKRPSGQKWGLRERWWGWQRWWAWAAWYSWTAGEHVPLWWRILRFFAKFRNLTSLFGSSWQEGYFTNAGFYVRGQLPKYWLWQLTLYLQLFSNVHIICSCSKGFWPICNFRACGDTEENKEQRGKKVMRWGGRHFCFSTF